MYSNWLQLETGCTLADLWFDTAGLLANSYFLNIKKNDCLAVEMIQ